MGGGTGRKRRGFESDNEGKAFRLGDNDCGATTPRQSIVRIEVGAHPNPPRPIRGYSLVKAPLTSAGVPHRGTTASTSDNAVDTVGQ